MNDKNPNVEKFLQVKKTKKTVDRWTLGMAIAPVVLFLGCATPRATVPEKTETEGSSSTETATPTTAKEKQLQSLVQQLSQKLEEMEGKLTALNDKIDATRAGVETIALSTGGTEKGKTAIPTTVAVLPHPVDTSRSSGLPVTHSASSGHAGAPSYINDAPIQTYRQAMIQLETQKYRDAILSFGSFLEGHPDHPLAGSAQYHIGESYYHLGEPKLAEQELQRVLTTYDRSPFVPETHRLLSAIYTQLKNDSQAGRHQKLLVSLYPQSPAAKEAMNGTGGIATPPAISPKNTAEVTQNSATVVPSSATPQSEFTPVTPGLDAPPATTPTAPSGVDASSEHSSHEEGGH